MASRVYGRYLTAACRSLRADLSYPALSESFGRRIKNETSPTGRARAYPERGFVKRLLGRDKEAEEDTKQGVNLAGKDAEILLGTLALLEQRLITIREMRKRDQKKIGEVLSEL